jgi:hypothetical protein
VKEVGLKNPQMFFIQSQGAIVQRHAHTCSTKFHQAHAQSRPLDPSDKSDWRFVGIQDPKVARSLVPGKRTEIKGRAKF